MDDGNYHFGSMFFGNNLRDSMDDEDCSVCSIEFGDYPSVSMDSLKKFIRSNNCSYNFMDYNDCRGRHPCLRILPGNHSTHLYYAVHCIVPDGNKKDRLNPVQYNKPVF